MKVYLDPSKRAFFEMVAPEFRRRIIADTMRAFDIRRRVEEHFAARGWPASEDLVAVACLALACEDLGAGGEMIRRPPGGELCAAAWPDAPVPAHYIVQVLGMVDLLVNKRDAVHAEEVPDEPLELPQVDG